MTSTNDEGTQLSTEKQLDAAYPDGESQQASIADQDAEVAEKPAVNPMMDPSSFPDGGSKAWLTVAGAAACLFCSWGWVNSLGIWQDYYGRNQLRHYSNQTIAWIPSLQIFFMLACGPVSGKVFDDFGPRYLLMLGSFMHVFGLMMASISKTYYQILLSQAVCSAIGTSFIFYPAFTCVSTWFFKKRGMALGLTAAGSSLGGVIFPIMVTKLIPEVGYGWTMRIVAFLILGVLTFANLTLRSRIKPSKRPFSLMAFIRPYRELSFVLLAAACFFFYWGMFVPFSYIVVEATYKGMSYRLANYLVPILNAASVFGRTIPNVVADKITGRFNVMIVMSFFTAILILGFWIPASSNAALITFAAFIGIATGAGIGLTPALCAQLSPIKDIGVRTGAIFVLSSFAALTGAPIAGAILIDDKNSFRGSQIFAGVSCLIGACLFVACRVSLVGWKYTKI